MSQAPGETSSANQGLFLVQLGRARKHLREGRLDQARQELEAAQIVRPNDEDVLNLISVIEFKLGRYEDAARAARQLVSENPSSAVLHANLGLILFKAGALPEAEQELRKAIELKPDHARSHLYLGLLYRTRGKLGLALEHLRFAGAKRLVTEIEDILRRSMREDPARASAIDRSTAAPEAAAVVIVPEKGRPSREDAPHGEDEAPFRRVDRTQLASRASRAAGDRAGPGVGGRRRCRPRRRRRRRGRSRNRIRAHVRRSLYGGDRRTGASSSCPCDDRQGPDRDDGGRRTGAFEAGRRWRPQGDGRGDLQARRARFSACVPTAASRCPRTTRSSSGRVPSSGTRARSRFRGSRRFQGTRFERILRAEGRGNFFLNDAGKSAYGRDLAGHSLHVEAGRLLALDASLTFRLDPIHDFRNDRRVDVLKVHGNGTVVLSIGGSLLGHDVSLDFPLIVAARDLVAWSGNLVPSVVEDRFLEEVMVPDPVGAPKDPRAFGGRPGGRRAFDVP